MFIKKEDQPIREASGVQNGKGTIIFRDFLKKEDSYNSGRIFSVVTIRPNDSIGYHAHNGEFEVYYILKGTAKIKDNDSEYILSEGDMMQCRNGDSHSIENIGTENLEVMALILYCHC